MKVLQLNHSDINGGAARAAYRIHHALRGAGLDSTMWVNVAAARDWTVEGPSGKWDKALSLVSPKAAGLLRHALMTENPIIHSPAILPSNWVKRVNASDVDVVHLHWVQGEMLSIADIGRIKKPIVWTLHDMWAFCGAEHYTEDLRWRDGYQRDNRPPYKSGFDLNRWTWQRKRKHWQRPMHIVTPSQWLGECGRCSKLMRDWPVSVIPNCLDTGRWAPLDQTLARDLLGLPTNVPLLVFGAIGGTSDPRKGFDLLVDTLLELRRRKIDLNLVIFGEHAPRNPIDFGFRTHYLGHLYDDASMIAAYSAADAMVIPSRQDNLPNTGVEAQACGLPVVAFDIGGMPDIVDHKVTGYIAEPFNTDKAFMRMSARDSAVRKFSKGVIAPQYINLYREVCQLDSR